MADVKDTNDKNAPSSGKIKLKIITHQNVVLEREVDAIYTQGIDGRFGVLKDHIPFVTALDVGVTKIIIDGKSVYFTTMGGIFQFKDNEATILTDIAEMGDSIDIMRAKGAKERAEARLKARTEGLQIARAQMALSKALARIEAAEKKF